MWYNLKLWGEIMTINEYREKYNENIKVLDKLYILLEKSENGTYTEYSKNDIILSIDDIKKEQKYYLKEIRKEMYKKYNKKMISVHKQNQTEFITKGNEIIIQPDSVNNFVSDVAEEKINKPDDITEVLTSNKKINKPDDITEVLTSDKKEKNQKRDFPDAKIIFDGDYKLIYNNGKEFIEPNNITLLEYNYNKKSSSNFNIIRMLKNFDEKNNSCLYEKYINNELEVHYNLLKLSNSKEDKRLSKYITSIAKRESKCNNKVFIHKKSNLNKIKAGASAIATAALLLVGSIGINAKLQKNETIDNSSDIQNEYVTEEQTEELTTTSDVQETTTESLVEDKQIEETKEIDVKTNTQKESKTEIKSEDINDETNIKIGDIVSFENTDLYYTSIDNCPKGNTNRINSDNYGYEATIISVVYQNKVIELIKDDSISLLELEKKCKEKYGDDIKISINFDVVDKENNTVSEYVGWVNSDDVKTKSKVFK